MLSAIAAAAVTGPNFAKLPNSAFSPRGLYAASPRSFRYAIHSSHAARNCAVSSDAGIGVVSPVPPVRGGLWGVLILFSSLFFSGPVFVRLASGHFPDTLDRDLDFLIASKALALDDFPLCRVKLGNSNVPPFCTSQPTEHSVSASPGTPNVASKMDAALSPISTAPGHVSGSEPDIFRTLALSSAHSQTSMSNPAAACRDMPSRDATASTSGFRASPLVHLIHSPAIVPHWLAGLQCLYFAFRARIAE